MPKKIPERKCVGCGQMKERRELIRIVRTPEGEYRIDPGGKAQGRGAYICRSQSCLDAAIKNHGLERSFAHRIDDEVYASLSEELGRL